VSFRTRLALAFSALALVPLLVFGLGVRARVRANLASRYREETRAIADDIRAELAREGAEVAGRLEAMAGAARSDNRLRLALGASGGGATPDRGYLLDYAGRAMRLAGLSMLQLQDSAGTVLSSGHFRNEFGRREPGVSRWIAGAGPGPVLLRARTASGFFTVLARAEPVRIGGRPLALVGGVTVDSAFLARLAPGRDVGLVLEAPGPDPVPVRAGAPVDAAGGPEIAETLSIPYMWPPASASSVPVGRARLRVERSLAPLRELSRAIDAWFALGLVAVAVAAALLGAWLAARLSRPLADLARRTARLDLQRLDVGFPTGRRDEVGVLARGLQALTDRLRAGTVRLRVSERRASLGEVARQVNHDVRNGLTPLRHVVRHLAEVAEREPGRLPEVFRERRESLEGGLGYLETLATRYARLSTRTEPRPTDAGSLAERVAADAGPGGTGGGAAGARTAAVEVRAETEPDLPPVLADPVALRRVLENLARNGIESLGVAGGTVWIRARRGRPGRIRLEVEDTGAGMTPEERERIFEQFYTTREEGAGLGLAIVQRLVTDMEGTIEVHSRPGRGTRFTIELPAAEDGEAGS